MHPPGSQGRDPGSGHFFHFFLQISHPELGTYQGTQQGTWTHGRFTGINFDFSKFTGLGSIYQVHREENLALDKKKSLKFDHLDLGTCHESEQGTWAHGRFTGNKFDFSKLTGPGCSYPVHREEILAPDIFFIFFKTSHLELGTCQGTKQGT